MIVKVSCIFLLGTIMKVLKQMREITDAVIMERNSYYAEKKREPNDSSRLTASISIQNQLPAAMIDNDHPLALACADAIRRILNQTPPICGCGPANEGYMLINHGIPTICGFGPLGGNVHGVDEWISVPSLTETLHIYLDVVTRYCHVLN
jgi:acetylornithine deacetylase/succinyl-diaminopimelate desuccinylase-like protein